MTVRPVDDYHSTKSWIFVVLGVFRQNAFGTILRAFTLQGFPMAFSSPIHEIR
jgi:hypothetical protein